MISQIMKEMAEKMGFEVIDLKINTDLKPEDLTGMPSLNEDK